MDPYCTIVHSRALPRGEVINYSFQCLETIVSSPRMLIADKVISWQGLHINCKAEAEDQDQRHLKDRRTRSVSFFFLSTSPSGTSSTTIPIHTEHAVRLRM